VTPRHEMLNRLVMAAECCGLAGMNLIYGNRNQRSHRRQWLVGKSMDAGPCVVDSNHAASVAETLIVLEKLTPRTKLQAETAMFEPSLALARQLGWAGPWLYTVRLG